MEMQGLIWAGTGEKQVGQKQEGKRAKTQVEPSDEPGTSYHDNCASPSLLPPESKNRSLIAGPDSTASTVRGCQRETKEETLLEKILGIPVITDVLWSYLTSEELKPCRFVNLVWKESATAEMSRRNLGHLQFSCRQGSSSFVRTRWGPLGKFKVEFPPAGAAEGVDLLVLFRLLRRGEYLKWTNTRAINALRSQTFPCSSFTFTDGNLTIDEDSTAFLNKHGEIVRTLRLERVHLSVQVLPYLFAGQLQNLRKLSLISIKLVLDLEDEPNNEPLWILPCLTTIHLEDPQLLPILVKLMESAPNLKFIGNLPLPPQFSKTHLFCSDSWIRAKLSLLVGLVISWRDEESENLSALESLHLQLPNNRIQILTLDHPAGALPPPEAAHHLLHILKMNALSLRVVHATFSEFFAPLLSDTSLKILANVEHLTVDVGKGAREQFDAALILKIFPNLTSIYLRFIPEMISGQEEDEREKSRGKPRRKFKMKWSDYFTTPPSYPPLAGNPPMKAPFFPTVKKLETLGSFPASWFKPLVQIFPHLHTVLMSSELHHRSPDYSLAKGKWLQLKRLLYGSTTSATPVKERHETFILSI